MAISFTPPGSRSAVQNDQTTNIQNGADTNDTVAPGIDTDFDFADGDLTALHGLTLLEAGSRGWTVNTTFAELVDGAKQSNAMTVTSDSGSLTNIRFTDSAGGNGMLDGDDSGLDVINDDGTTSNIVLFADTASPDTIVYGINEDTDEVVFVVEMVITPVDASDSTVGYNVISYEPVFHADGDNPDDPVDLGDNLRVEASDLSGLFDFSALDATKFLFGVVGDADGGFVVIGKDPVIKDPGDGTPVNGGGAGDLINTSKGGGATTIGVNNQHFTGDSNIGNVEQGAYFTYSTGIAAGTYGDADDLDPVGQVSVGEARLQVSQTQAASTTPPGMKITTLNYGGASDGRDFVEDLTLADHGAPVSLTAITVYDTSVDAANEEFSIDLTSETSGGPGPIFDNGTYQVFFDSANEIRIIGLDAKDWVEWETSGLHNRVLIEVVSGKWDIGAFEIDQPSTEVTSVGDQIIFDDDAPTVNLVGNGAAMLVLDETVGDADDDGSGDPLATNSITAANYLTTNDGAAGTDGEASDVWTLDDPGDDIPSGLVDTATGNDVVLNLDGSDIVGTVSGSGEEVVRFSINASTGEVTVTQKRAVEHDDPMDPDENTSPEMLSGIDKIVVRRTIVDNDGDDADDTVDLTAIFKFEDDGPNFDIALNGDPVLALDETDPDGDENGGFIAQNTILGSALFTISNQGFGSDGMGATPVSYAFQDPGVPPGTPVDSGLVDAQTQQSIVYTLVGGVLIGTVDGGADDGAEVIRYAIDATTGDVTASQSRAVDHPTITDDDETLVHPGSFKIVIERTITDGDGDFVTKNLDITVVVQIDDDGPVIAITGGSGATDGDLEVDATTAPNSDSADLGEDGGEDGVKSIVITDYTGKATGTVMTNDITLIAEQVSDTLVRYFLDEGDGTFGAGDTLYYTYELLDTGIDGIVDTATFTVHTALEGSNPDFSLNDLPSGQNGFGILAGRMEEGGPLDPDGPALVIFGRDAIAADDGTFTNDSDTVNTSKGGGPTTIGNSNQMIDGVDNKGNPGEGIYFGYVLNPDNNYVSGIAGGLTQNEADDFDNISYAGGPVETDGAFFQVVQTQGNPKEATARITAFDLMGELEGQQGVGYATADYLNDPNAPRVTIVEVTIDRAVGEDIYRTIEDGDGDGINFLTFAEDEVYEGSVIVETIAAGDTIRFKTGVYDEAANTILSSADHDLALIEGVEGKFDIGDYGLDLNNPVLDATFDFEVTITDNDDDPFVDNHSVLVEGDMIV